MSGQSIVGVLHPLEHIDPQGEGRVAHRPLLCGAEGSQGIWLYIPAETEAYRAVLRVHARVRLPQSTR